MLDLGTPQDPASTPPLMIFALILVRYLGAQEITNIILTLQKLAAVPSQHLQAAQVSTVPPISNGHFHSAFLQSIITVTPTKFLMATTSQALHLVATQNNIAPMTSSRSITLGWLLGQPTMTQASTFAIGHTAAKVRAIPGPHKYSRRAPSTPHHGRP